MKNLLLLLITVAVSFSFSCSTSNKSSNTNSGNLNGSNGDKPLWSTIEYHYYTGPVSPEYQYRYKVIVNEDKNCQFIYYYSASVDTNYYQNSFTITDSQLAELNKAVKNSKVLDENVSEESNPPIGGTQQYAYIIVVDPNPDLDQSPRRIEIPVFPEAKYKENIEKLYSTIQGLIPPSIMEEAKSKN